MELDLKKSSYDNNSNSNSNKRLMKFKDNEDSKMQLSYAQRLENSTRKMQERYNQAKDSRQKICVIGLSDAPNPSRRGGETMIKKVLSKGVRKPLLSTAVKHRSTASVKDGGIKRKFQGYGNKGSSEILELSKKQGGLNEKKRLDEVFKLSYAERAEMVKRKLQHGYDPCQDSRIKKACLIR